MKINLLVASFLLISGFSKHSLAQESPEKSERNIYRLPVVGLGAGLMSFSGDVGSGSKQTAFSKFRPGYSLYVEQRFLPFLGVALNGSYGKLSANERSATSHLNFESKVIQADIQAVFHFDNGFIEKKTENLAPFLAVGFGYMMFDAYGDLKDKNGKYYNYWKNGDIRDLPQADSNIYKSVSLQRDYKYETQLKDSVTNYARNTFSIPMTAGFTLKLTDYMNFNLSTTYNMLMSDWVDNVKSGKNDSYWFTQASLRFNLGGFVGKSDEGIFADVDFEKLEKEDSDGDGVNDNADLCPGTEKGIKVDSHGCEADDDKDGVPNHIDKEPNTKRGVTVDTQGREMTDAEIEKHYSEDSLAVSHDEAIKMMLEKKDQELAAGGARKGSLPEEFAFADINKDGIITSNEITAAIDSFFEGGNSITVEKINKLIDYFFEQ